MDANEIIAGAADHDDRGYRPKQDYWHFLSSVSTEEQQGGLPDVPVIGKMSHGGTATGA